MDCQSLNTPLRDRYDVLVVGGGIYGACATYEAARRNLSVLLVERDDFGAATSFNSMKIVHGGLRYLQDRDFARVVRSHRELQVLLGIAPDLVRPLHCRLTVEPLGIGFRLKFRAGLLLYACLSSLALRGPTDAPGLPSAPYPCWYDGIILDTERFLLSYLHTAVQLGQGRVAVRNYSPLETYVREKGKIVAARIAGVGEVAIGRVIECIGTHRPDQPVVLSMNMIVDPLAFPATSSALGLAHPSDGRFVFIVPWRGRHIVGTYDHEYPHDPSEPLRLEESWVDEFLDWLAPVHPELAKLSREAIRFLHAGLLPRDEAEGSIPSRHDQIDELADGLVRVRGTKYTTSRVVASKAVELATKSMAGTGKGSDDRLPRLIDRDDKVRAYVEADPARARPLLEDGAGLTRGEVLFAIAYEQARTLSDVLLRRTAVANSGHPGSELVNAVASVMQQDLGWSENKKCSEIEQFESAINLGGWHQSM